MEMDACDSYLGGFPGMIDESLRMRFWCWESEVNLYYFYCYGRKSKMARTLSDPPYSLDAHAVILIFYFSCFLSTPSYSYCS